MWLLQETITSLYKQIEDIITFFSFRLRVMYKYRLNGVTLAKKLFPLRTSSCLSVSHPVLLSFPVLLSIFHSFKMCTFVHQFPILYLMAVPAIFNSYITFIKKVIVKVTVKNLKEFILN